MFIQTKSKLSFSVIVVVVFVTLYLSPFTLPCLSAGAPTFIAKQGQLRTGGQPANGSKKMWFRLYTNPSATPAASPDAAAAWQMNEVDVYCINGSFNYPLGNGIDGLDFANTQYYMAMSVDGTNWLRPFEPIAAIPYAFAASTATCLRGNGHIKITGAGPHYILNGNFGLGTAAPTSTLQVLGGVTISSNSAIPGDTILQVSTAPTNGTLLIVKGNGNVGIGTFDPSTYKLNVNGPSNVSGNLNVTGNITVPGTVDGVDVSAHASNTLNPHFVTAAQVALGNVTNESKTTMFANPAFTGGASVDGLLAISATTNTNNVWLRLNQNGSFTNGVHTPGFFNAGSMSVGDIYTSPGANNLKIKGSLILHGTGLGGVDAPVSMNTWFGNLVVNGGIILAQGASISRWNGWPNTELKAFIINHPMDNSKYLVHGCLEGPEAGVFYRGTTKLKNGTAEIVLPEYFEALTSEKDRTVLLTPQFDSLTDPVSMLAASYVSDGKFIVKAIDKNNPEQIFCWEVKAVRKDVAPIIVEPQKDQIVVHGSGPYKYYEMR